LPGVKHSDSEQGGLAQKTILDSQNREFQRQMQVGICISPALFFQTDVADVPCPLFLHSTRYDFEDFFCEDADQLLQT
jgi:hypothetical protein